MSVSAMKGEMTMREAGRRGGNACRAKHGLEHYQEAGQKGGEVTAARGAKFYQAIGKKGGDTTKARHGAKQFSEMGKKGWKALQKARQEGRR